MLNLQRICIFMKKIVSVAVLHFHLWINFPVRKAITRQYLNSQQGRQKRQVHQIRSCQHTQVLEVESAQWDLFCLPTFNSFKTLTVITWILCIITAERFIKFFSISQGMPEVIVTSILLLVITIIAVCHYEICQLSIITQVRRLRANSFVQPQCQI